MPRISEIFCANIITMSDWTPERIEKQRELAKRLVAEGKFGGANRGQGRPKKPRASEYIADQVADDGKEFYETLKEIIREAPYGQKMAAIDRLVAIEESERKIKQQEEDNAIEHMQRHQLLALVIEKIEQLGEAGVIPQLVEGRLVEVEDDGTDGISEDVVGVVQEHTG